MSMSDLISGGAGCGPSNPLQNIGKRFGQDRGAQQDTFASNPYAQQQGPSFRSHGPVASSSQEQPAFFNSPSQQAPLAQQSNLHDAFDVSQLRGNLPSGSRMPVQSQHHRPGPAPSMADLEASFRPAFSRNTTAQAPRASAQSGWATDFLSAESSQSSVRSQPTQQMHMEPHSTHAVHPNVIPMGMRMGMMSMPHTAPSMHFSPSHMQDHAPQQQQQHQINSTAAPQLDNAKWAEAFTAFEASSKPDQPAPVAMTDARPTEKVDYADPQERDELARTAGRLVSSVEHDQSSKFRQSNFLDLMRKIRDKQAGIQGDNIVENADAAASTLDKGKSRAHDFSTSSSVQQSQPQSQQEAYSWANQMAANGGLSHLSPSVQEALAKNNVQQSDLPQHLRNEQHIQNQQALNDMWAEEDARSQSIERQAMSESAQAFVGDGGDVTARMREDDADAQEFERYQRLGANIPHASTFNRRWEEDMNRPLDQMDDDEVDFVGRRWEGTKGRGYPGAQTAEWDKLQSDWDNFEVTSAGIRPVTLPQRSEATATSMQPAPAYRFLSDNPYIASTRHHAAHAGGLPAGLESVLEKEAAVQQNPQDASAWFDLGVKQQENEREVQAIAALRKALDLDANLRDAWLALAVSYTNENDRTAAYEAIEKWIDSNDKYAQVVQRTKAELAAANAADQRARSDSVSSHSTSASVVEKHSRLTNLLIAMVRSGGESGEIDADVQVALGVIFNSSEDYDKAVDCFSTALSVRPQDWLLYNRLGATLSNSGRSAEAIQYYHHALNLQPEFVRCHFNLSISCLNLKMYQDAAEHIYTALTLQQAEAETLGVAAEKGTATSGSLWETFRVALELLNRSDLASKCARRDINAFDLSDFVAPVAGGGLVGGVGEVPFDY
ncbi:hypothetical protein PHSY_003290 [Pseudozyma hubeiensis SY62]|uniref:Peroxisomal targeting signal receptor n=1 Tax=Pseudozyma hubeiensis (strain SY62) TaxID=1305764 RepID=R9P332_PSEHS|nr:hypothetical protein PHSY_003290 [Pseudozyma hubeiensis SY62]GAC95714.1 hypothetical protein PHSY_003290 [Pseudozyma hubeiensis SY62]